MPRYLTVLSSFVCPSSNRPRNVRSAALRRWWIAQILAGIAMVPLVLSALIRGAEPLAPSGASSIVRSPALLISGWALGGDTMAIVAGGIVFALLLFFSLLDRTGRVLSLAVTCGALLVSVTVGFVKPMFKPPVFTANLVLFLVLGAAFGISAHFTRAVRTAAMTLIVGLAACTLPWSQRLLPAENYRPAGEFVAANAKAGDVVVVPNLSVYWGMLRYAVGAAWGHPLDVMPPSNEAWTALKKRFGPDLVALSRLDPRSDFV